MISVFEDQQEAWAEELWAQASAEKEEKEEKKEEAAVVEEEVE